LTTVNGDAMFTCNLKHPEWRFYKKITPCGLVSNVSNVIRIPKIEEEHEGSYVCEGYETISKKKRYGVGSILLKGDIVIVTLNIYTCTNN